MTTPSAAMADGGAIAAIVIVVILVVLIIVSVFKVSVSVISAGCAVVISGVFASSAFCLLSAGCLVFCSPHTAAVSLNVL